MLLLQLHPSSIWIQDSGTWNTICNDLLVLTISYRVYKIDTKTFEVVDSITYTADLDQASTWLDGPVSVQKDYQV